MSTSLQLPVRHAGWKFAVTAGLRQMFGDLDEDALVAKLAELRREHRSLDAEVRAAQDCGVVDQLKLVRLKRRKLMLKDMIFAIEDQLNPDIIA
ncbi:MAG: YdcH family protein [Caulobacterales bacterium]|uniref:YdcH family protein n=1 Tax=Glycocaulis sp. TaxID=1969725 RepID=UPI003F9F88D9